MASMAGLESQKQTLVNNKIELEQNKSLTHEESLLFRNDVNNTETSFSNVKSVVSSVYGDASGVYRSTETSKSSIVRDSSSRVYNICSAINNISGGLDTVLNEKIIPASLQVWTEKSEEFQQNVLDFRNVEKTFDEFKKMYYAEESKKEKLEKQKNNLNSSDQHYDHDKKEFEAKIDTCESNMKSYLVKCEQMISKMTGINSKLEELLTKYLMK